MKAPGEKDVVVTGLGCVTPIGHDLENFWRALLEGRDGAAEVTSFDATPFRTQVGCEVRDWTAPTWHRREPQRVDRASDLALAAAREALAQAGLDGPDALTATALSIGTTMGAPTFLDDLTPRTEPPWADVATHSAASITENVAVEVGLGGAQVSLPAACSAGNYAIGCALDLIRAGEIEAVVAGGTEAYSMSAFAGFSRLNALAPDVCRPFDRDRKGLLLGEGAGMLVLESAEHAQRRGAKVLARVLGYGLSCDAHHITGPHPEGEGAERAMRNAFADAGIDRDAVGYISCHGTGTRPNDRIETLAIRAAFGDAAGGIPVSSIKALTGHMMGAASAVEAIACVLALREGVLPPTWNLQEQDPECDLDVIPNAPRDARVGVALNNSYAFGGNNACVALGAPGAA